MLCKYYRAGPGAEDYSGQNPAKEMPGYSRHDCEIKKLRYKNEKSNGSHFSD
jgi:hypothetical protein